MTRIPHQAIFTLAQTENSPIADQPTAGKIRITRIRQDDFLAQLTQALATYDTDGDGLLSDEDWQRVALDLLRQEEQAHEIKGANLRPHMHSR